MTSAVVSLIQMELDITSLAHVIGDNKIAACFMEASEARKKAMNSIFWNSERGQWLDYWLSNFDASKVVSCTKL